MEQADKEGRVVHKPGTVPTYKRYLDEMLGNPVNTVWSDIKPLQSHAAERLPYPTQKPEALLERIIEATTRKNDLVLDPFCGCGTSIVAAHNMKRRWIGIDITHLSIALMRYRLRDSFGNKIKKEYEVHGMPVTVQDAEALAKEDAFEFEFWALSLVEAQPTQQKRGADKGIDGRLYFHDDASGATKQIVISVKSGKTGVAHMRDLRGVVDREKAEIGVLITLQRPTAPMRSEAASAGFYESKSWGSRHPKLQILTVTELLDGKGIDFPSPWQSNVSFKKAKKKQSATKETQKNLELN